MIALATDMRASGEKALQWHRAVLLGDGGRDDKGLPSP